MRKFIFTLIALTSFVLAVLFSFKSIASLTGIWLTFSIFFIVLAWPEIAESISIFGNNIKLRKVEQKMNELRSLAEGNTRTLFELMQTQMRFGGVPEDEKQKIYKKLTDTLIEIGFTDNEIKDIQSRWHYWIEGDYVRRIVSPNSQINDVPVPKEKQELWYKKRQELLSKASDITPNELREVFKELDVLDTKFESLIDDFEYYKKNKEHKNLEKWKKISN